MELERIVLGSNPLVNIGRNVHLRYSKQHAQQAYFYNSPEQPFKSKVTHGGDGMMEIHRISGDSLHTFSNGEAHIDKGPNHAEKLNVERLGDNPLIKDLRGYF